MKLLVVLSFLAIFVGQCHAWCTYFSTGGENYCSYNGQFIPLGQTRTLGPPTCIRCTCLSHYMSCCSVGIKIRDLAPECEIIQNGCYQRAVLKTNHNKSCPFVSAVGR